MSKGKIFYLRITTRGDPITGLPAKSVVGLTEGFQHPCSDNSNMRQDISEDCITVDSAENKPINCFYTVYAERKDIEKLNN